MVVLGPYSKPPLTFDLIVTPSSYVALIHLRTRRQPRIRKATCKPIEPHRFPMPIPRTARL
jgi:hypothetical protein